MTRDIPEKTITFCVWLRKKDTLWDMLRPEHESSRGQVILPKPLRPSRVAFWLASALFFACVMFGFGAADAVSRMAFVVGVGGYKNAPSLPNPPNDANDIGALLVKLGFATEVLIDPDRAIMEPGVRRFGRHARQAEVALFYYAGHALEYGGRNWLLPVNANISTDKDLRFEAVDLTDVTDQLDGAARLSLLLLDSCRDNPFKMRLGDAARGIARDGLAEIRVPVGTLVAFSTAPGTTAEDGSARNSPFTHALLANIPTPGLEIRQVLDRVRRDVRLATRGRQVPWENSAMEGRLLFRSAVRGGSPQPAPRATDRTAGCANDGCGARVLGVGSYER